MAKFDIIVQSQQVQARLSELIAQGANMQPAWQAVGNNLVNRIRLGFRISKDPWGNTWLPIKWRTPRLKKGAGRKLSLAGKKQMAANTVGSPGQPLRDTGRLARSVVAQASATDVVVGTNLIYARVHQFGAVIHPKKGPFLVFGGPTGQLIFARRVTVPARPYMPISAGGTMSLPATWAANIIRTLAAHFKLGAPAPSVPA